MLSQFIKFYFDTLLVQYPISLVWSVKNSRSPAHIYPDKHATHNDILCGKVEDRSLSDLIPTSGTVQHQTVACCLFVRAWNVCLNLMEQGLKLSVKNAVNRIYQGKSVSGLVGPGRVQLGQRWNRFITLGSNSPDPVKALTRLLDIWRFYISRVVMVHFQLLQGASNICR